MSEDLVINDGEPGWSPAVFKFHDDAERAEVFVGAESTVWINEAGGRLSVELFVSDTVEGDPLSACLARRPLADALWEVCNDHARGDSSQEELSRRLKEPIAFDEKDDVAVLTAYRETLKRAVDLCDALIEEHAK